MLFKASFALLKSNFPVIESLREGSCNKGFEGSLLIKMVDNSLGVNSIPNFFASEKKIFSAII